MGHAAPIGGAPTTVRTRPPKDFVFGQSALAVLQTGILREWFQAHIHMPYPDPVGLPMLSMVQTASTAEGAGTKQRIPEGLRIELLARL